MDVRTAYLHFIGCKHLKIIYDLSSIDFFSQYVTLKKQDEGYLLGYVGVNQFGCHYVIVKWLSIGFMNTLKSV